MAVNPMMLIKMKERMELFRKQHPKAMSFFQQVGLNSIETDSVVEVKVTRPDGKVFVTNIRVTPDDMETLSLVRSIQEL